MADGPTAGSAGRSTGRVWHVPPAHVGEEVQPHDGPVERRGISHIVHDEGAMRSPNAGLSDQSVSILYTTGPDLRGLHVGRPTAVGQAAPQVGLPPPCSPCFALASAAGPDHAPRRTSPALHRPRPVQAQSRRRSWLKPTRERRCGQTCPPARLCRHLWTHSQRDKRSLTVAPAASTRHPGSGRPQ